MIVDATPKTNPIPPQSAAFLFPRMRPRNGSSRSKMQAVPHPTINATIWPVISQGSNQFAWGHLQEYSQGQGKICPEPTGRTLDGSAASCRYAPISAHCSAEQCNCFRLSGRSLQRISSLPKGTSSMPLFLSELSSCSSVSSVSSLGCWRRSHATSISSAKIRHIERHIAAQAFSFISLCETR